VSTTQNLINYYAGLLIAQYREKPNAYATIQALVAPVIMDQLPAQVRDAFVIGNAIGVQLDILGKYAGVTRRGKRMDGSAIVLNDVDFTSLIKLAIIRNNSGSSLYDIQRLLATYFLGEIYVFDHLTMQLSYEINAAAISSDLAEMFITEGLLPKPMGVQLASVVYVPDISKIFGFRTYALPAYNSSPFNSYAGYQTDWTWLSYADTL
jgi:hypothetical protein